MLDDFALPPLEERTFAQVLSSRAEVSPDRCAVTDGRVSLSYERLWETSQRMAGGLRSLGVCRGDRVIVMLRNHVDAVSTYAGCILAGAIEVPINPALKGNMLRDAIQATAPRVIVVESECTEAVQAETGGLLEQTLVVVHGEDGEGNAISGCIAWDSLVAASEPFCLQNAPWDPMGIFFTSGTTGPSKGVVTTEGHAYSYAAPDAIGGVRGDDVSLVTLPLFHVGGQLACVYNGLIAGASCYIMERFSPSLFWQAAASCDATVTMLVGTMVSLLMADQSTPERHSLRSVVFAPVSQLALDLLDRFRIPECWGGYGSTEAGCPMVMPAREHAIPLGVGWPRPDFEVAVVDEHDRLVPPGTTGELIIRPREPWSMMNEYYKDAEATIASWGNLWFHTGDAVRVASDGQYVLVDRLGDAIRRRGENISSGAVEAEMNLYPGVIESAVIGVPDDISGQELLAVIVSEGFLDFAHVVQYLGQRLPYFMVPRYYCLQQQLPKSASGKTQKRTLREMGLQAKSWDRTKAGIRLRDLSGGRK